MPPLNADTLKSGQKTEGPLGAHGSRGPSGDPFPPVDAINVRAEDGVDGERDEIPYTARTSAKDAASAALDDACSV